MRESTIKQLEKREQEIRNQINKIEEREIEKIQKPRLKKLVGKCYAYRKNSYSCPKNPSDYWDVFKKILEYVDTKERGFHFIFEEFQIDSNGKISFEVDEMSPYLNKEWWDKSPFGGYEEITNKEYEIEKIKMLKEMELRSKMKKILNSKYD